jgi:hypothetical protein
MEVGCGEFDGGGSRAGLDRVFFHWSKVLSAKSLGRVVISVFFMILYVKCNSTADIAMKF